MAGLPLVWSLQAGGLAPGRALPPPRAWVQAGQRQDCKSLDSHSPTRCLLRNPQRMCLPVGELGCPGSARAGLALGCPVRLSLRLPSAEGRQGEQVCQEEVGEDRVFPGCLCGGGRLQVSCPGTGVGETALFRRKAGAGSAG